MPDEIQPEPEASYSLRRIKSVLGKANAVFGNVAEEFHPVYFALTHEQAFEVVPEAAQALEEEIRAVEHRAAEAVEGIRAQLISAVNSHLQKAAPSLLAALYPPLTASLNQVSPIAAPPAQSQADSGLPLPSGDDLPEIIAGDNPPAATSPDSDGGKVFPLAFERNVAAAEASIERFERMYEGNK